MDIIINPTKIYPNESMGIKVSLPSYSTITGTGTQVTLQDTIADGRMKFDLKGNTSQTGTPTPSAPKSVDIVTGQNTISVSNSDNSENQSYTFNLGKNLFNEAICTKKSGSEITAEFNGETLEITGTASAGINMYWDYSLDQSLLGRTVTLSYTGNLSNIYNIGFKKTGSDRAVLTSSTPSKTFIVTQSLIDDINQFAFFCVSGAVINASINIQLEISSTATDYSKYFTPIELCKIGNYQDYIYRQNGNWYIHKEIGKIELDGSGTFGMPSTNRFNIDNAMTDYKKESGTITYFSNYYKGYSQTESNGDFNTLVSGVSYGFNLSASSGYFTIRFKDTRYTSTSNFKTFIQTYKPIIYYVLETATDTQITDTSLINQLEALRYATTYLNETNITQTNAVLPFNLEVLGEGE